MKKLLLLILLPMSVLASPIKGIDESYQDWNLVCDNTGTCRLTGYQSDGWYDIPVSVLFTRPAGENAKVSGKLSFLAYDQEKEKNIPIGKFAEILINGQSLGKMQKENVDDIQTEYSLTDTQITTLLNALKKNTEIQIVSGEFKGKLSDKGAAAAMLRMDEFQQRLNTPSALIRKGNSTKPVLAPRPAPKITAIAIPSRQEYILKKGTKQFDEVMALLRQANGTDEESDGYCPVLHQDDNWLDGITIYPLTNSKVLAESLCWRGAYQEGAYYAVMDDKLTRVEQQLAHQYNGAFYDEQKHFLAVNGSYKGRGIGDCWFGQNAVWNGKIFIRTSEWTSGSCKGVGGGFWHLPIFESEVVVKE
ncbi:hypothetical protein BKK52_10815 [Rodentibacter trehalosifermentans]|uniref:DUF1176 domain-containing protein n=1 Tax=Rodentibacter trehalosifermentans TaxID=1908263 RepID=A0A1V3IX26_9PAST|nr:DUF1176 domain-containing protein [Rodentibacter trehalosifermentans]OOF46709.1 hypothetical protein BKK52_10815 [Rodentibacter trehalosifermentans]